MTPNHSSSGEITVDGDAVHPKGFKPLLLNALAQPIAGPLLALVIITFVFSVTTSTFLTVGNLSLLFQQSVVVGTLALGQTLIVLVAGIDLACGAILVLGTVVIGSFAAHGDVTALVLGLAACMVAVSINGIVITRFGLPPFIVTLGTLAVVSAVSRLYTKSQSYPISSDLLTALGNGPTTGLVTFTYGSMLWIGLTLLLSYVLTQTPWGVRVYAIGNSPSAARLNGIHVGRITFSVYALAGLFYFFAAWQALGRTPIADPSSYQTANLDSITAVVIGGTSLFGGRGGVAGTFIGALIVTVLKNGLTQAGIDSLYQQIATGILVVLAVGTDQYLSRRKRS